MASTFALDNTDTVGSSLIEALEAAWDHVCKDAPELPKVVFITGSGVRGRGVVLGHYAHNAWANESKGTELPEIFVSTESMALGADDIMITLRHEAAHALAQIRGIQDVTPGTGFHNTHYKALAEELGLNCEKVPGIGWSETTLTAETAEKDALVIELLELNLATMRKGVRVTKTKDPKSGKTKINVDKLNDKGEVIKSEDKNYIGLICDCKTSTGKPEFTIRMARGKFDSHPGILCGACEGWFRAK